MGWFVGEDAADAVPPGRPVPPERGVEASDSRGVKRKEAAREKDEERETVVPLGRVLMGGEPVPPMPVVVGGGREGWREGDEDSGAAEAGGALGWLGLDMAAFGLLEECYQAEQAPSQASERAQREESRRKSRSGDKLTDDVDETGESTRKWNATAMIRSGQDAERGSASDVNATESRKSKKVPRRVKTGQALLSF